MKTKLFRTILSVSAAALAAVMLTVPAAADYEKTRTYSGQFADVASSAWYYGNVADAYELGLIDGTSESSFDPDGTLTIAQTIKLTAVCHQLLTKGAVDDETFDATGAANWYDPYVTYAAQRDIVTEVYEDYNAPATRGMVAVLFSRTLAATGVTQEEINAATFGDLKDVPDSAWYATSAYRMYRWGILAGDENGNINPERTISRSEMSAVVTRVINPAVRVRVNAGTATQIGENTTTVTTPSTNGYLVLYEGTTDAKNYSGLTSFAADFSVKGGNPTINASSSLELVNSVILEKDNISFRLYKNSGYDALSAVRGLLEEAAVGVDGTAVRSASDVYSQINELCYLWANGKRMTVGGLWYRDHGDYTTYAFYLTDALDLDSIDRVQLICGRPDAEALRLAGLTDLAGLIDGAYSVQMAEAVVEPETPVNNEQYTAAIASAKSTAVDIPFEYESDRCYIIYGAGLYGTPADDYRLMFIFRDGTSQTIVAEKVNAIRVNSAGKVLYYTVTAPDGGEIQYGVNFDD